MLIEHKDFIGKYEDIMNEEECQEFIDYFEHMQKMNKTWTRQDGNDMLKHEKNDTATELFSLTTPVSVPLCSKFIDKLLPCFKLYRDEYSILKNNEAKQGIRYVKIQKTMPGEGYHVWHYENGSSIMSFRSTTFMLYLNDVEEGGETEFLYQKRRFQPKTGSVLIWPAGFTHTHRGNPPLSGIKYIVTGWIEWLE
jgi:hypothetical protein